MFDLETSLGSLFSLGWQAAWKAAANDTSAFERLKNDADWHVEQVRAHVAELAAATRPIAFAEREPERGAKVLLWWVHYDRWTACNGYAPGSYQADDGELVFTHWLPLPPAPDTAA